MTRRATRRLTLGLCATLAATAGAVGARAAPSCPNDRVALDVGHTLEKPGAISARGATEFGFNRALATAVADAVRREGIDVVLIGLSGAPKPLPDRTAEAKKASATLFLSLHHDSVQTRYLKEWEYDGHTQHHADGFRGYALFVSGYNPKPAESERAATAIGRALNEAGFEPSRYHGEDIPGERKPVVDPGVGLYRYDNLIVLRTATMPAVLLEAGVIVDRDEELRARDPVAMARMAGAIAGALRDRCAR